MKALADLAERLVESLDPASAAEILAEHVQEVVGGAARVYLLRSGDRCATCTRARECRTRDRCLQLVAGVGAFARPPGHVDRVPRTQGPWAEALAKRGPTSPADVPPELEAPSPTPGESAILLPLQAAGQVLGVVGLRVDERSAEDRISDLVAASALGGATLRVLAGVEREAQRFRQIVLVNELGRKVNSILNDDLLLRQAAQDIQRTFGFHNVMVFMLEQDRKQLRLRAQASAHAAPGDAPARIEVRQGIVGRAVRLNRTEVVPDVSKDADFVGWYADSRSEIAVPIQIGGVVEGVLNVEGDRTDAFTHGDRLILETVANQLAIALENARLFGMVKQREDRYRSLLESNPGAVFHLDQGGRVIFANPAAEVLTGLEARELVAQPAGLLSIVAPTDRPGLERAIAASAHGDGSGEVEFQVIQPDASTRTVIGSVQPLAREQGPAGGVVLLATDRTRERELQERLVQWEKLSAIGSLVSGVAHELNNPLAGILGFAQLMLARPSEQWTRQEVEKIEKNARRCQAIVENLLAFARQAKMSKRPSDVNEIIDSVIRLNEYQLHLDNIEIERDLDLRVPLLSLDVNRWQQVFINLTANAHQALAQHAAQRKVIRFETRLRPDHVSIRVLDTGPGVAPDIRTRVFEPFFTTKQAGTGLGLGICFGIVTEHGGTIELDPTVSEGACFRISLPLVRETRPAEEATEDRIPGSSRAGLGKRALVVDDEEHVREVVGGTLTRHHYVVDAAGDAHEALDMLAAARYDVVLSDVFMPGEMNGLDLHERLQEERPDLARRMIFLTGNVLDDGIRARIAERGVPCIDKPFDIHVLAALVHDVAERGATTQGERAPEGTPESHEAN